MNSLDTCLFLHLTLIPSRLVLINPALTRMNYFRFQDASQKHHHDHQKDYDPGVQDL